MRYTIQILALFLACLNVPSFGQSTQTFYDIALQKVLKHAAYDTTILTKNPASIVNVARKNYLMQCYRLPGAETATDQSVTYAKVAYSVAGVYYLLAPQEKEALMAYSKNTKVITIDELNAFLRRINPTASSYFSLFHSEDFPLDIRSIKVKDDGIHYRFNGEPTWPLSISVEDSNYLDPATTRYGVTPGNPFPQYALKQSPNAFRLNSPALIPERNLLNNSLGSSIDFGYGNFEKLAFSDQNLGVQWRPDAWYNAYDGVKIGARIKSAHLSEWHKVDVGIYYSTGLGQGPTTGDANGFQTVSWFVNYSTRLDDFLPNGTFKAYAGQLDGLDKYTGAFSLKSRNGNTEVGILTTYMNRKEEDFTNYLFDEREWGVDMLNAFIEFSIAHKYSHNTGFGGWKMALRGNAPGSDYNYGFVSMESKNRQEVLGVPLNVRVYGQYGWGDSYALESMLYLSGANPETRYENPVSRSAGFIPADWGTYGNEANNFHESGGLNLRGYAGYLAPHQAPGDLQRITYRGTTGASVSMELPWTELLNLHMNSLEKYGNFSSYLFGDLGIINSKTPGDNLQWASGRADAGIGAYCEITQWGKYTDINPLVIRFDVPFWVNRPTATNDFFAFRWVLGVSKTF